MQHAMNPGGHARPSGRLSIQHRGPEGAIKRPSLLWRISNFLHWWRGLWPVLAARLLNIAHFYGTLDVRVLHRDGSVTDYGRVSYRVVTTAYVTALATYQFDGSGPAPTDFDYHDCGTGNTAESAADTELETPYGGARVAGTPTNPSAGVYRNTGTISPGGTFAITEHGLFSASSNGTLLDRSVFSAINVVAGDSIQFQYSLTYSAGG